MIRLVVVLSIRRPCRRRCRRRWTHRPSGERTKPTCCPNATNAPKRVGCVFVSHCVAALLGTQILVLCWHRCQQMSDPEGGLRARERAQICAPSAMRKHRQAHRKITRVMGSWVMLACVVYEGIAESFAFPVNPKRVRPMCLWTTGNEKLTGHM